MKDRITKELIKKEDIKDLLYDIVNEFENEIDCYTSKYKEDLTDTDINIMFEFLEHYEDKIEELIEELYED